MARHVVIPAGVVSTGWPAVEAKCNEFDSKRFDRWQQGLGRVALGKRADGKYAATIGGVTLSIPRQVAKTFIVGRVVFALAILNPGLTVLWTAHRTRLSDETFRKLKALAQTKGVAPYVLAVRSANGQQAIEFRNGSRVLFGAREQGFGLGFDEVDVIVFDEAQRLTQKALDDMIPAANQSRQPSGALVFYMGTPPRPEDSGEVFTARRVEALEAKRLAKGVDFGPVVESGDAVYVECSADENVGLPGGPALDNHDQWRKANPSFPERTPLESMLRMRKQLKADDSWRREALGVWDNTSTTGVIDTAAWESCGGRLVKVGSPVVLAVETTQDRRSTVLVTVGTRGGDKLPQVEVVPWRDGGPSEPGSGTSWVADRVAAMALRNADIASVVVDSMGASASLVPAIKDALEAALKGSRGVDVVEVDGPRYVDSCALLFDAIRDRKLRHGAGTILTTSVKAAAKRDRDGVWVWDRRRMGEAGSPLIAMTLGFGAWCTIGDYDPMASIL